MKKAHSHGSKKPLTAAGIARALTHAEEHCVERGERLTAMRRDVYEALLEQHHHPLSAYDLLEVMQKRLRRKLAPLTIYRALEFLVGSGLVHRLESNNAFMACTHPDESHEAMYLVCSSCGDAEELEVAPLGGLLRQVAEKQGFAAERQIVELQGTCKDCRA